MSRATLIDQSPEEENTDQVEQIEATEIQQEVEQPPEPESTLPEK